MSKILNLFEAYASANKLILLNDFNRCLRNNGIRYKMNSEGFEDLLHSSRKFMFEALQSKNGLVYIREDFDDEFDEFEDDEEFGGGGVREPHELFSTDHLEDEFDDDRYSQMRSKSRQHGPGHYGDHGYAYYVCPECGESGSDEECASCMEKLTSSDYVDNLPSNYAAEDPMDYLDGDDYDVDDEYYDFP